MIRTLAIASVLAGLATGNPAPRAAAQPTPQFRQAPDVFFSPAAGRSYLGVDIQDITPDRVSALKLKEERGVEITMVDQDAPAGKVGLKEHDVILEYNGKAVESAEQMQRLIRETPPGRTVNLGISRDGNPLQVSVQLADRAKMVSESEPKIVIPPMPRVEIPPIEVPNYNYQFQIRTYSSSLGIQTENLGRQLGDFFGVKDGEGVLVRSVEKGSPAEKGGIRAGDVIVRADDEKLTDRADLSRILNKRRQGGKLSLVIVRDKREQTIVVELPPRNSQGWWDNSGAGWSFDSDEVKPWRDQMENWYEQVEPKIERAQEIAAAQMRAQTAAARKQIHAIQPQIDKAMRQAQRQLQRAQEMLERQQKKPGSRLIWV